MPRRPRDPGVPQSPTEYFGTELRAYREAAGLSRPQLAEQLGYTPQWIGQIEAGRSTPSEDFAKDCDTFFHTNGTFHRIWTWIQLLARLHVLPPGFRPFAEAEQEATYVKMFAPLLIPGLLQHEGYAREVLGVDQRPGIFEELFAARMQRQAILDRDDPPWLLVVIREAVIRDLVGGPDVMKAQLQRLLDLAALPHAAIQVIPANARVYQSSGFVILSFDDRPDVGFIDGAVGHGQLIDTPHEVAKIAVVFDQVRAAALSLDDSVCLIRSRLEEL
jgi:transcriptional regulator with XRE-family HTH domain